MPKLSEGTFALGGLAVLAIWIFFVLPFLYGPIPSRWESGGHKQPHSEQSTQHPQGEPRGSLDAPFFVQVLPTTKTTEERAHETKEREEKASNERWLTIWTGGLAIFTLTLVLVAGVQAGLFLVQLRYMRKGMEDATTAATAAATAAQAARDQAELTFRPKIRLKHLWLTGDLWNKELVKATLVFVNSGTARAFLQDIGIATFIVARGKALPTDPNSAKKQLLTLHDKPPLDAGISLQIKEMNDWRFLSDEESVALRDGQSRLYFVGAIVYKDGRGLVRTTAFCRVLQLPDKITAADRGRFIREEDPDYEYED